MGDDNRMPDEVGNVGAFPCLDSASGISVEFTDAQCGSGIAGMTGI